MKRIFAAVLALCLCAVGAAMAEESAEVWAAGDMVVFGSYEQDNDLANGKEPLEWIVLKTEGDRAMLITRYLIDARAYHKAFVEMTWSECTLRQWLNDTFLKEAFSQEEQARIQEVLVDEINNTDSRKYALLTSTDSFYRYKEAVKEIVQEILEDNEARRERLERELTALQPESAQALRCRKNIDRSREADSLVYETLREFDFIEVKYNRLIEQKAVFAARANARIRYLLREGEEEDDNLMAFIGVLRRSPDQEEILAQLGESYALTALSRVVGENSFYARRDEKRAFEPAPPELPVTPDSSDLTDFVVRPEYTQKEIDAFIRKNSRGGAFSVTEDTVSGVADLEKLLFVWRDAAAGDGGMRITGTDSEPIRKFGCKYTKFTMEKSENSDD